MNYNLNFDLAALLLVLCLLCIYVIRPKFNDLSSKIYQGLMLSVFLASLTEILTCLMLGNPTATPMLYNQIIIMIYLYSVNICSALYYRYVVEITAHGLVKTYEKAIFYTVLLVNFILIILIPFTNLTAYFDENHVYQHGPLFVILYIIAFFVLLMAGIRFFRYRKYLNRIQKFAVIFFYVINVGAIIFERIFPNVNILTFVTAVFMFLLYVSLQNPEYYVDTDLACYNEEAFLKVCEEKLNNAKKFVIISFYAEAYDYVNQAFGVERGLELSKYVSTYFVENFRYQHFFHISDCNFVYVATHKMKHVEKIYEKVWNDFNKDYEINNVKVSLQPRGAAIVVPQVVNSTNDIIDAIYFSTNKSLQNNTGKLYYMDNAFLREKRRKERIAQIIKEKISLKAFELRYLPILDVKADRIVAAEALVRLYDEQLGEIETSEFIEVAEEYGLVYDIDKAIFQEVCKCLHRLEEENYDIRKMQINLSTLEIMQGDTAEHWLDKMRSLLVNPDKLNFEIKESVCKELNSNLIKNMKKLKEKGCTFAIDNYGTGFSNIIDLLNMEFQIINIDRSILWEAMKSEEAMHILKNMIAMYKELEYQVLITGVENLEQFETVVSLDVDYIKGYIISRPVTESEFSKMLFSLDV